LLRASSPDEAVNGRRHGCERRYWNERLLDDESRDLGALRGRAAMTRDVVCPDVGQTLYGLYTVL
jgi:hypothetical protein